MYKRIDVMPSLREVRRQPPRLHAPDAYYVADAYLKGRTQYQIAAELGIKQPSVYGHIKKLREQRAAENRDKREQIIFEQLAKIDKLEVEAWFGLQRAKEPNEILVTRQRRRGLQIVGSDGIPFDQTNAARKAWYLLMSTPPAGTNESLPRSSNAAVSGRTAHAHRLPSLM